MLTDEERAERLTLVGFCEKEQKWYKVDSYNKRDCPTCGGNPSTKIGFQLTTQRTFNPAAKKLSKAQIKNLGIGA